MCKLEQNELFKQLHKEYYETLNSRIKLNNRNAILTSLIPILEQAVGKINNIDASTRDDLFQYLVELTLNIYIPKWKPTGRSITGYYRRCFFRASLNWLKSRKIRSDKEILIDSDSYYWESHGESDNAELEIFHNLFKFKDENKQEVYNVILELVREGSLLKKDAYLAELAKEKGISVRELKRIHNHALITCREYYLENASNKTQDYDKETFFGRLSEYLSYNQIQDIIKVFSECKVKVPKWEDNE